MRCVAAILTLTISLFFVPLSGAQAPVNSVSFTFTPIDVPGAGFTIVTGINKAGDMVGVYGQDINADNHGFLYSNGIFTFFDYPGMAVTSPGGINDSGMISGFASQIPSQRTSAIGFVYDGTSFATLKNSKYAILYCRGINNAGTVVGAAGQTIYATKGFQTRGGNYMPVRFPGQYNYASAEGINSSGAIVGYTASGIYDNGYIYRNGIFQSIQFPGASVTAAWSINDNGVVVGWYSIPYQCLYCGFAYSSGKYVSFSYPGAEGTFASGINANGIIVGSYTMADGTYHGFVTSAISVVEFDDEGGVN
ncbi:MAG TPA: hypothetical protein VFA68_16180 [Terriglobales bacterium]|nr:hypothetical protein [Terriglobales bacterium]